MISTQLSKASASVRKSLLIAAFGLLPTSGLMAAQEISFDEQVLPLMRSMCYECHNSADQKGSLDLEVLTRETDYRSRPSLLENIDWVVSEHEMPPTTAKNQPTEEQRQIMLDWARDALMELQNARPNDPGVVVSPRINSAEYDYVLRDLTGEPMKIGQFLTDDSPGGEGFLNVGSSLTLSVGQFESFLSAAKMVMNHARIVPEAGPVWFDYPLPQVEDQQDQIDKTVELYVENLNEAYYAWYGRTTEKLRDIWEMGEEEANVAAFLEAAWLYHHREKLGQPEAGVAEVAEAYPAPLPVSGVNKAYQLLSGNIEWKDQLKEFQENIVINRLVERWRKLPEPINGDPRSAREEIREIVGDFFQLAHRRPGEPDMTDIEIEFENKEERQAFRGRLHRGTYLVNVALDKVETGEVYLAVSTTVDGPEGDFVRFAGLEIEFEDGRKASWEEVIPFFLTSTGQKLDFGNQIQEANPGPDGIIIPGGHWVKFEVPQGAKFLRGEAVLDPDIGLQTSSQLTIAQKEPQNMENFADGAILAKISSDKAKKVVDQLKQAYSIAGRVHKNFREYSKTYLWHWDSSLVQALGLEKQDRFKNGSFWQVESIEVVENMAPRFEDKRRRFMTILENIGEFRDAPPEDLAPHAKRIIGNFATKAWRRDVTIAELQELYGLYEAEIRKEGMLFEHAMHQPLVAILMAPRFLYRFTESRGSTEPYALNDRELATRLAFTLWASLPDQELLDLAEAGKLGNPEVLRQQALRMIADPRFRGFIEQFGSHWLHFADYEAKAAPDMEKYDAFTPELKADMHEEVNRFLKYVFQENHSMLTLLESDFTFLNKRLANHYGIDGAKGDEFQKVQLPPDSGRGGLIGMGAFHMITSTPLRTSPVHRGIWVYEVLLGKPIPEPPPNVPQLSDDEVSEDGLTVAQQLAAHRDNPACFSCHDRFDPLGVAMENFDPIGRWRTEVAKDKPVDALGVFGDGTEVQGADGLKKTLLEDKESFLQNFARKLIGYGTSRSFLLSDKPLQDEMLQAMAENNYQPIPAILTLIESNQFRMRRDSPVEDQQASLQ